MHRGGREQGFSGMFWGMDDSTAGTHRRVLVDTTARPETAQPPLYKYNLQNSGSSPFGDHEYLWKM